MITKLRRQMIFMVMGVVTVLLMAIFLILYHSAVSGFETRSVEALRGALQQEQPQGHGAGDSTAPPEKSENKPDEVSMEPKPGTLTPPAGREDRPILVLEKRADGTISILKNTLYTLETPDTESLFALAEADNREYGKLPEEHLRFLKDHTAPDGTVRYAFGDTYSEEQSLHRQITASLLIGAGAFLIFLIFAVWFSGWAVKPVEEAWKRQRQFAADAPTS